MNHEQEHKKEFIIDDGDFITMTHKTIKYLSEKEITNGREIMLYCKICALSTNNKCTATNRYFAKLLCTTERNITKYITHLKEKGVVKIYIEGPNNKRTIYSMLD